MWQRWWVPLIKAAQMKIWSSYQRHFHRQRSVHYSTSAATSPTLPANVDLAQLHSVQTSKKLSSRSGSSTIAPVILLGFTDLGFRHRYRLRKNALCCLEEALWWWTYSESGLKLDDVTNVHWFRTQYIIDLNKQKTKNIKI